MLFPCLLVRRPRRLNRLRGLAEAPRTVTRLPGPLLPAQRPATAPPPLPDGFQPATATVSVAPAAVDRAELQVQTWLHHDQHGRTDTTTGSDETEARR